MGTDRRHSWDSRDAQELGIFTFHKEGREEAQAKLLVSDLRAGGIKVDTGRETGAQATMKERGLTMAVVDKFKGTAISDKIGKVRTKPVTRDKETFQCLISRHCQEGNINGASKVSQMMESQGHG